MEKATVFNSELNFIQNQEIKEVTKDLIEKLPDYFFDVPASSTGKYHPKYALEKGGLVKHTKAAVRIADELFRMEMFNPLKDSKGLILSALILHDGLKHGKEHSPYCKAYHPVIMAQFIKENVENKEIAEKLYNLIITHMGQWNTDYRSGAEIMPKPATKEQNFVHLCDYLASRKCIEFNFAA